MLLIILVVIFTMAMFLWALATFGQSEQFVKNQNVLAWICVLILGIVVFLSGFGVIVWRPLP